MSEATAEADAFAASVRADDLFRRDSPIHLARAPGRLDVMGGIADYSGSLVLELPLAVAAMAAVQANGSGEVVAVSGTRRAALPASAFNDLSFDELSERLRADGGWAAYVVGPIAVLARHERRRVDGLTVLVASSVPEGKGLSSSAAVELASITAAASCLSCRDDPRHLALLAQAAEHRLAGAPCGVMDQLTAAHGEAGHLLAVLCRPAEILGSISLPPPYAVWGIDSGVRHSVAGSDYRRVRCATFMGKVMLGLDGDAYLTERRPSEIAAKDVPETVLGRDFLRRHGRVPDDVSVVEPDVVYPVRAATTHAVEEHGRVQLFAEVAALPCTDRRAELLGELMFQSHASYTRLGLGTVETDAIVEEIRRLGWSNGLAGARISGGGSGGTVSVLGRSDAQHHVEAIAARLGNGLVSGSSDGSARFGTRTVVRRPGDDPGGAIRRDASGGARPARR